jgi:hypothetical protein
MDEDILADFDATPVTSLDGKAVGAVDANGFFSEVISSSRLSTSSGVLKSSTSIE